MTNENKSNRHLTTFKGTKKAPEHPAPELLTPIFSPTLAIHA
jgi:hypothetical protein